MTLQISISEAQADELKKFENAIQCSLAILELWSPKLEQEPTEADATTELEGPLFSRSTRAQTPPTWAIWFTPSFQKSISSIDKKLQGRILIAISELSEEPITPAGDTKKPLSGELKGLWRYRLGDYRLIYEPNENKQAVVLLEFSARSSIYD